MLTTGIDNNPGANGVDTFDGSLGGTGGNIQTLGSNDSLNGGNSVDTLAATLVGGTTVPTLTLIETLDITATAAATLDLSNSSGYTTLKNSGTAGGILTFNAISSTAPALVVSNTAVGTTFGYTTAAVAGTADSVNLSLTNVTGAGVITINGVETITVASNGVTANSVSLTAGNATTVNVNGSNAITLAGMAAATRIDGSTLTGALTASLAVAGSLTGGSGADALTGTAGNDVLTGNDGNNTITAAGGTDTITTGSGNDRIVFATATNLTVADSVNAGAGTNTLAVTAADIDTNEGLADTADLTALSRLTGIQAVEVTTAIGTAATDADINLVRMASSITTVTTTVAQTNTNAPTYTFNTGSSTLNLGSGAVSAVLTALGNTLVASGTGTADALSINKTGTAAEAVMATSPLTITGFETINIGSGALAGGAQTTGTIGWTPTTANATVTLNVTGSAPQSIGVITPAGDNLVVIDGSGMTAQAAGTSTLTTAAPVASATGTVSIVGSSGQDVLLGDGNSRNTINGGDGIDTITGGSANDSLSGGAGNDSITAAAGTDTVLGGDGDDRIVFATAGDLTVADSIDGGAGTNTLSVSAADVETNNALSDTVDLTVLGRVTNIQAVEVTGIGADAASDDINVARIATGVTTVNTVAVTGATAATFTFNAGANTLNMGSAGTAVALGGAATLTVAGTGTADSLTINRVGTAAEAILGTQALTVSGIETVAFNTGSVTNTAQTTGAIGWTPTTTNAAVVLNVTGANALTTGVITPVGTGRVTIDGSGMTAQVVGTTTLTTVAPVSTGGTVSIVGSAGQDVLIGDIDNSNTIIGGAGVDTITGGSAADNLSGDDGIDSITGGGGNDIISGGAGNDVIVQTIAAADSMNINGGADNDTLTLTGFDLVTSEDIIAGGDGTADVLTVAVVNATAGAGAGVTGWETLVVTTAGPASQAMVGVLTGDTTITRVDFTGAANAAQGVTNASANLATVRTVSNNNTLSVARAVNTTSDALTFGAATNAAMTLAVLTVNNEETLNLGQGAITTTTNASTINSLNAIQATTINVTGAMPTVVTAVGASAAATGFGTTARGITINAANATNTVSFTAGTALATQPLTMTGSSSAASTLTGGLGADTLNGGSAADSLTGGAGIDSISGNLGADTLVGEAGNDILIGGESADIYSGGTGWDTLNLTEVSSTADRIDITTAVGGTSEAFGQSVAGLANDTGGDNVIGMTWGTDTIRMTATNVANFVHGTHTAIGTEGDVNDGTAGSFLTSVGLVSFSGDAVYSSLDDVAITFTSPATALTEARFEAALQYVITGTDNADVITGGDLADTITGGAAADSLTGGAGADQITGGTGQDTMVGGTGVDTFVIAAGDATVTIGGAGANGTAVGFDVITDLTTGTVAASKDTINLPGTAARATAAAGVNGNDTALTIGGGAAGTHTISATGLFTVIVDGGAALAVVNDAGLAAFVDYLRLNDIGDAGAAVVFTATYAAATRGSVTHSFIYQQTTTDGGTVGGYSVVDVVGVTLVGLESTATATDVTAFIA